MRQKLWRSIRTLDPNRIAAPSSALTVKRVAGRSRLTVYESGARDILTIVIIMCSFLCPTLLLILMLKGSTDASVI